MKNVWTNFQGKEGSLKKTKTKTNQSTLYYLRILCSTDTVKKKKTTPINVMFKIHTKISSTVSINHNSE